MVLHFARLHGAMQRGADSVLRLERFALAGSLAAGWLEGWCRGIRGGEAAGHGESHRAG